jgi:serine phosphatase RsbU (regulator of sigma subunit)
VTKPIPDYLRLYESPAVGAGSREPNPRDELYAAFEQATGWLLRRAEASAAPSTGGSAHIVAADVPPNVNETAAERLAAALDALIDRVETLELALTQREAQLATAVPVVGSPTDASKLVERFEAILHGGAEVMGCQAAALYVLDDATSELALRACWNLPPERFTSGPRALRSALADLEALCGHAIALEDVASFGHWNVPEPCHAAVCVPVSSATVPLGTLWFFASAPRAFSDKDTNLAEIVAGRIAAEMERGTLLAAEVERKTLTRELEAAARIQQSQTPRVSPWVEGARVTGWSDAAGIVGSSFHDWLATTDGRLLLAAGQGLGEGVGGALLASTVRAALRAHAQHELRPERLLQLASALIWSGSAGDQLADLFCGVLDPITGHLVYAQAGEVSGVLVGPADLQRLVTPQLALGYEPDTAYSAGEAKLPPGGLLIVGTRDVWKPGRGSRSPLNLDALATEFRARSGEPVESVARWLRALMGARPADRSLIVVGRK